MSGSTKFCLFGLAAVLALSLLGPNGFDAIDQACLAICAGCLATTIVLDAIRRRVLENNS